MVERRKVKLPGSGLHCESCGTELPRVSDKRNADGLILRRRACPNAECGHINKTIERVIGADPKRPYFRHLDQ